jgi:hypothetical protein
MKDKPILVLDFDGVIHSYTSGWKGATVIPDPPVPGAIDFIREAAASFRVAIYSSRSRDPEARKAMMLWLIANGLPEVAFDAIDQAVYLEEVHEDFVPEPWHHAVYFPTEKPPALVTLDDRAITFTGVWPEIADLRAFKPWNKP